ncbi:MAG: hypothetical protein SFU85_07130 [Candidatus Methylacidiphilales bacterium]|nr:hypothetical protein [Candidatus Methylacidiphilales bacterium]
MSHQEESCDCQKMKFEALLGIGTAFIAVLIIATIVLVCNQ